jgi:hypothetical protein
VPGSRSWPSNPLLQPTSGTRVSMGLGPFMERRSHQCGRSLGGAARAILTVPGMMPGMPPRIDECLRPIAALRRNLLRLWPVRKR